MPLLGHKLYFYHHRSTVCLLALTSSITLKLLSLIFKILKNCCGNFGLAFLDTFLHLKESKESHYKSHLVKGWGILAEKNMHEFMHWRKFTASMHTIIIFDILFCRPYSWNTSTINFCVNTFSYVNQLNVFNEWHLVFWHYLGWMVWNFRIS